MIELLATYSRQSPQHYVERALFGVRLMPTSHQVPFHHTKP